MTLRQLEKRVSELENQVADLQSPTPNKPWWVAQAGTAANDKDFEQMVRLGKKHRATVDAKPSKRKRAK